MRLLAVDGRSVSPSLEVCPNTALTRLSIVDSWSSNLVTPGVTSRWLPHGRSHPLPWLEPVAGVEPPTMPMTDWDRTSSLGGGLVISSVDGGRSGIEADRRLLCLRCVTVARCDLARRSEGMRTCIFFARRQKDLSCWHWDDEIGRAHV